MSSYQLTQTSECSHSMGPIWSSQVCPLPPARLKSDHVCVCVSVGFHENHASRRKRAVTAVGSLFNTGFKPIDYRTLLISIIFEVMPSISLGTSVGMTSILCFLLIIMPNWLPSTTLLSWSAISHWRHFTSNDCSWSTSLKRSFCQDNLLPYSMIPINWSYA